MPLFRAKILTFYRSLASMPPVIVCEIVRCHYGILWVGWASYCVLLSPGHGTTDTGRHPGPTTPTTTTTALARFCRGQGIGRGTGPLDTGKT